jgi:hypothetical protein
LKGPSADDIAKEILGPNATEKDLEKYLLSKIDKKNAATELPKRLLIASRVLTSKVNRLGKNKDGDLVYNGTNMKDHESQELKAFGDITKKLLSLLKGSKSATEDQPTSKA